MSIATILALLAAIETIIQDTPQALALFDMVKSMLSSGLEPSTEQWIALNAMLAADHARVQTA
jgi:hypothetical protein